MTDADLPEDGDDDSHERPRRVFYPILRSESDGVLHVAAAVAEALDAELVVGYVPNETPEFTSTTAREVAKTVFRSTLDPSISVDVTSHTLDGSDRAGAILTAAGSLEVDAIAMGTASADLRRAVAKGFDGDVLHVGNERRLESIASILLPVAAGDGAEASVAIAGAIARTTGASVEVVHVVDEGEPATTDAANDVFETALSRLHGIDIVDTRVLSGGDVAEAIGEESQYHDLTVIAAPRRSKFRHRLFGSTAGRIREEAQNTVVTVRRGDTPERSLFGPEPSRED